VGYARDMTPELAPLKRAKRFYRAAVPQPMELAARDINLLAHCANIGANVSSPPTAVERAPRANYRFRGAATIG